jgi:riboflavin kinase/FMN adenylyltransferase
VRITVLADLPPRSPEDRPRAALSIGVFDSVHIGHQRLLRQVAVDRKDMLPVVCTFRQNPGSVLGTRPLVGSVVSFRQKLEMLESLGIAEVVLIDFSSEISTLTGKKFIDLLGQYLTIRKLVVGYNFHMGKDRDTDVERLSQIAAERDAELVVVPATLYGGRPVSSSRIRHTIREGDFAEVRAMMGRPYCLDLREVELESNGRHAVTRREALGQLLPRPGEYPVAIATTSGDQPVRLSVSEDTVAWTRSWQEDEIEICFDTTRIV